MSTENGNEDSFNNMLEDFYTHGFTYSDSIFSDSELADIRHLTDRLVNNARERENHYNDGHWNSQGYLFNKSPYEIPVNEDIARYLHKIQGVCTVDSSVLDKVFKHPKIISAVEELLNGPWNDKNDDKSIDVFGTKFFPVFPGGNSVNWHQDSHYFGTGPSQRIISCAIYIEPTDIENGCLRLIPSSHMDNMEYPHQQGFGKWSQGEWVDIESNRELRSRILDFQCMKPGTVVLFDARLLHAANENSSLNRTRYSFFGHYIPGNLNFSWRGVNFERDVYRDRHVIQS